MWILSPSANNHEDAFCNATESAVGKRRRKLVDDKALSGPCRWRRGLTTATIVRGRGLTTATMVRGHCRSVLEPVHKAKQSKNSETMSSNKLFVSRGKDVTCIDHHHPRKKYCRLRHVLTGYMDEKTRPRLRHRSQNSKHYEVRPPSTHGQPHNLWPLQAFHLGFSTRWTVSSCRTAGHR
jgi:hypothetical protein